jgi:hypothetical protein
MWNANSMALFEFVWQDLFGRTDTHTETRIIFSFTYVIFLGVSHLTFCREMRGMKTAVRERDK